MKPFSHKCEFVLSATDLNKMPEADIPEVAFAGRSNVGKSSLLNTLVNQKKLAHTSNTPGRTKQINFFTLDDMLMLVDLPGYGFAKTSKNEQAKWDRFIGEYLKYRHQLKLVFILIDCRRGIMEIDKQLMAFLDSVGSPYQIVLTKVDKISKAELEKVKKQTLDKIKNNPAAYPEILSTTSKKCKDRGIEDLQLRMIEFIEFGKLA